MGSFSYTSRVALIFVWEVCVTHHVLVVVFFFFFLLIFIWGVSLTHPMLASFLSGEFLLRIPWWLSFSVGSFPYTSRVGFIFMWVISLSHIPC